MPLLYSKPYSPTKVDKDLDVIEVQERFRYVFYYSDELEFAGMARQDSNPILMDSEGLFTTDCQATSTLTFSLFNMTGKSLNIIAL